MNRSSASLLLAPLLTALAAAPALAQDSDDEVAERILAQVIAAAEAEVKKSPDRTLAVKTEADKAMSVKVRRLMRTRRVTLDFQATPFADAAAFLRDVTGLNIVVSRKAQELVADSGKSVTLKLSKIRLGNALNLMMKSLSEDLCYGIKHGVLMFGTKEEFDASLVLRFYDIQDLVKRPPDFPAPPLGLPDNTPKGP